MKVLQINLHHCKEASSVLRCNLDSGHTGVSLIQEPYFYKNKVRGLGNAGLIHYVTDGQKPARACVFTRKDVNSLLLKQFSNSDFVAVQIRYLSNGREETLICCSAYLAYDGPVPTRELERVVDACKANGTNLLIGCDANSHHIVWGSSDINIRGRKLLEYMNATDLTILNRGCRPTFVNKVREEVIDLTLCSPGVESVISDWHVSTEVSLSDHQTIVFYINADVMKPTPFRNPRKTDWPSFGKKVEWRLGKWNKEVMNTRDIEEAVTDLTDSLIFSFNESCKLRLPKPQRKPPWYTTEVKELKHKCSRAWNARRHDWNAFRECRKAYKRAYRQAKRKSWRDFCESVEEVSSFAKIHKILSKDRSDLACCLKLPNGEFTSDESSLLGHLLETHFPGCTEVQPGDNPQEDVRLINNSPPEVLKIATQISDPANVRWAITSFSPFKSPGPDGIFPALLQEAGEPLLKPLSVIFTSCLALGYVPKAWREVRVTFIPKPGRADYENAKNHRGISLSSFFLKTLERVTDRYIRDSIIINSPLCSNQHAYQRGKSTMSALHKLTTSVENAFDSAEHMLAVFLDIEGAFDRATFDSFKNAAQQHNIDQFIIEWILYMLQNRTLIADFRGKSVRRQPVMGCPQGGVLSPLIWLLIADSLLLKLNEARVPTVGFADDFSITIRGKFIPVIFDRMQEALRTVETFTNSVGLSVNPSKVGALLFTKSRNPRVQPLRLFGKDIALVNEFKFLGLTFDNKLNWNSHINQRIRKACMAFGQCRRAIGKKWGLSPKSVHWLYTSVVRPLLSYGALAWWHRARLKVNNDGFNHLQRLALLGMTGAMSTTPTAALECLCGLLPLHIFVEGEARAELCRLKIWGHFVPHRSFSRNNSAILWKKMVSDEPLFEAPKDAIVPVIKTSRRFKVVFPTRDDWADNTLPPSDFTFFTDGSLCDGLSGAGVFSANPETRLDYNLGPHITVFQAELFALVRCAFHCLQEKFYGCRISICSDSQAALKSLQSYKIDSSLVLECRALLDRLTVMNDVSLLWVPGHSDILGNEEADTLARNGSSHEFIGPIPFLPLSKNWAKSAIHSWTERSHKSYWQSLSSCKHTKLLIKEALSVPNAKRLLSLKKSDLRKLIGVITGHFYFNKHLCNMRIKTSSICDRCEEDEDTAYHLICLCPRLANRRFRFLGDYVLSEQEFKQLDIWKINRFISEIDLDAQL